MCEYLGLLCLQWKLTILIGLWMRRLCCLCGASIMPNPSNMCVNCIRSQVDITAGLQKQVTVLWCKECNRYLNPPKNWVRAELESKELLTFCVKRIKGLQKVKGASFATAI